MLRGVGLALSVLALAGCGNDHQAVKCSPKVLHALTRLQHDVSAITNAPNNAAVNHATDRFLNDVFTLPVDNLTRNREIDHAAAALAGRCPQCFQALEANRPIITIRFANGSPTARCESELPS
ncbi:MAG TPA: hypothetical protein VFM96_09535 [Gaiellaceae bacterium]|nr:hypothetical protein [Gaiellaceae bacterium]